MTKRAFIVFLSLLLAALPALGLAGQAPITLTDMAGREITLARPATKIVALMPGDCESLYAIGAGDTLVGRGEWCNYPEQVAQVPSVESGFQLNVEQVVALAPEVVIMTKMGHTEENAAQLEKAGIQVFISDAQSLEDVYACLALLGKMTGHEAEAEKVAQDMQAAFADLAEKVKDMPRAAVYFETTELQYGLWPAVKGTFLHEIGELLHLDNVFGDMTAWAQVSEEEVIKRNPAYIVSTNLFASDGRDAAEEIKGRPGWDAIDAVKEGRVYGIGDMITRPAPRLVEAAQTLYELVYGQAEAQKAA